MKAELANAIAQASIQDFRKTNLACRAKVPIQTENPQALPPTLTFPASQRRFPKSKANHFKLDLNRQLVVYHYEVTIWWGEEHLSPETEAKLRLASRDKRRILAEFSKAHKIATNIFDGQKCLYSTKKLELKEETKTVHVQREIGEKIDEFYVRIRQVGILRYDSQENCRKNAQALDIAIRCALSHNREFLGRLLLRKVTNESAPEVQPTTPRSRPPAVRGRYNPAESEPFGKN
ncbi:hypothetical protein MTO96_010812 [Rhipicephalus appendiculatus]